MSRTSCILLLASSLVLGSCISVEQLSIDYMLPADVSFPVSLKRVAIVNNVSQPAGQAGTANVQDKETDATSRSHKTYNGNAQLTAEALAGALAEADYFDEVVICDSALNSAEQTSPQPLTSQTVGQLTDKLDVDFLISLENIRLDANQRIGYISDWNLYYGAIDVKVYPTVRIYLPNRKVPMATINSSDSIFWEATGTSEGEIRAQLIKETDMLDQASEFAGTVPAKHLLPYWKTANRYFFYGSSVALRDAAIYAREGHWDTAIELWQGHYHNKKGKQQMYAAYNIALGYEMQDNITQALEWALKAQAIACEIDKIDEQQKTEATHKPHYIMTTLYVNELQERKEGMTRLNAQMERIMEQQE